MFGCHVVTLFPIRQRITLKWGRFLTMASLITTEQSSVQKNIICECVLIKTKHLLCFSLFYFSFMKIRFGSYVQDICYTLGNHINKPILYAMTDCLCNCYVGTFVYFSNFPLCCVRKWSQYGLFLAFFNLWRPTRQRAMNGHWEYSVSLKLPWEDNSLRQMKRIDRKDEVMRK